MKTILLLSIHGKYASRILQGEKQVELRKVRPRVVENDLVVIYAPSPICALLGAFRVGGVVEAAPADLWKLLGDKVDVSLSEFEAYFGDAQRGFGILVKEVWPLDERLSLRDIRNVWSAFAPPQGYKYLDAIERRRLSKLLTPIAGSKRPGSLPAEIVTGGTETEGTF